MFNDLIQFSWPSTFERETAKEKLLLLAKYYFISKNLLLLY